MMMFTNIPVASFSNVRQADTFTS